MITVTSEQKPVSTSTSNSEVTSAEKFVFLDRNGITVTKRNSMPTSKVSSVSHISQTDNDISYADDDDLEKMTLDDLPEANKLKTITSNFQDNFNSLQSWSNSPATSRVLQNHSDSTNGYNILVTNLHREVNKTDIVELFSDLGTVADVQMIQHGTALVTYINKDEAILACETYHNRLLDGQPMQCTLLPSVTSSLIKPTGRFTNRLSPMVYGARKNSASTSQHQHQISRSSPITNNTPGRPVNFTVRMP
ncbi:polymerase delta-interacting protein 3-like isoform X2 [Centruroides vittatus]